MKRLFLLIFFTCVSCDDGIRDIADNENDIGCSSSSCQTDSATESEETKEDETTTQQKTFDTHTTTQETGSEQIEDTETDNQTDTDSNQENQEIIENCDLVLDWILKCVGVGSRYDDLKDRCKFNLHDDWSSCLSDCIYATDCNDFLSCENGC